MTKPGSTHGIQRTGRTARVTTGAGVVKTNKWIHENLAWGELDHIGLDETSNTLSSGQRNAELGVETTWMAPPAPGPDSDCGTCVLHRSDGGHVVWSGTHQVQLPSIRSRTPEVSDNAPILNLRGEFCTTTSCTCSLPKLSQAIQDLHRRHAHDDRALAGSDSEYEPDFADDIPDPANGEVQVQFEASPPADGGEDVPADIGSPSGRHSSRPLGADEKWRTTSEGMQTYPSAAAHCFRSVDFSNAVTKTNEIDEGNDFTE